MRARVFSALLLLFSLSLHAQSVSVWPAQTFTGDSTGVVMQLNSIQSVGSAASGVLTLVGTSLTTVTFAVQASTDGGLNYFAIPVYLVASPTTAAATSITATASAQYGINLAGVTHLKIVTSGTFTATSVSFQLATSPNASVAKGATSGGTCSGCLIASNNLDDVSNAGTSRGNLGAAAKGANSDITSLTGLTTPLSATIGGTGSTSLAGLRYANSGSADSAASSAQVSTAIGAGVYDASGAATAAILAGYYGGTATGLVNVYAVTLPSSFGTPTLANLTGLLLAFVPNLANVTTTPTLTVNALAATTIVKGTSTALFAGDLATNTVAFVVYNGTNFVLQNPQVMITQSGAAGGFTLAGTLSFSGSNGIQTQIVQGNSATAPLVVHAGTDSGSAGALTTIRGENIGGASGTGGTLLLQAGADTGSTPVAQGLLIVNESFTTASALSATFEVVTLTSTQDQVGAAALGAITSVGIAQTIGGTSTQLYVAVAGKSTVRFDGTPVIGDIVCAPPASTGTIGLAHDNGSSACPSGQRLGMVTGTVSGTGSGATATVLIQIG